MKNGASASRPIAWFSLGQSLASSRPVCSFARVDERFRREEPAGEIAAIHLHREEQHGATLLERHVQRRAECERGLALAGAGREHDEVRALVAEQQLVEVAVAGGGPGDLVVAVVELLELVHRGLEHRIQRDQRVADAMLGHVEHELLGAVERGVDVVAARVAHLGDVAADRDQPPQQSELVHDRGVFGGVRRCRRLGLDAQDRLCATDGLEQPGAPQVLGDRDRVDRLATVVEIDRSLEEVRVRGLVEVAGVDTHLDRRGDRVAA